jgi:hypothetical protein
LTVKKHLYILHEDFDYHNQKDVCCKYTLNSGDDRWGQIKLAQSDIDNEAEIPNITPYFANILNRLNHLGQILEGILSCAKVQLVRKTR